ncbi:hypothetical protein C4D60_Mb11t06030 [Musa balbisiana]|uniref:HIT domain-containing protein n=1 Tax=Musa balbisiana TaxID=52838 RepID=A0A4S8J222_MUSBA|nr:hypothetical protein C4D60_Mb11t06030 [Musa balbisiana]
MPSLPSYPKNHMATASRSFSVWSVKRGSRLHGSSAILPVSVVAFRSLTYLVPPLSKSDSSIPRDGSPRYGPRSQSDIEEDDNYTFGPYKIHRTEIFHSTLHSFAMAKLWPLELEHVVPVNQSDPHLVPFGNYDAGELNYDLAMPQQLKLEPYAVHTTFQFSGSDGKRHRLREAMLFYDQPAYYDTPGGFLSFKPGIPKSLLLDGPHTVQSHFSLVNYQLRQIRTALAVASLLNRTLVMPRLWCRFDRLWSGHHGIFKGTLTKQPFVCPMDHLFEIPTMLHGLSEEVFGPQIHFREYSFLQNPSVPKHVKESLLNVQLCDAHSEECNISNETSSHDFIQFPRNSTEQMYMQVFSQYKDIKVLHFSSMANAFQGFSDEAREAKFRNRVKRYVGKWCCVENNGPGHIYYDMYWDEKPGWKPKPPRTRHDDHPPCASHSLFGLLLRRVRDRAALPPYSLFRSSPAALRRTSFLLTPNPIRLFRATVRPRSGSRSQSEMEEVVNYTFGPYKIHRTEVFHSTLHSFAMVNLRPLLPGHILLMKALIHLIDIILLDDICMQCSVPLLCIYVKMHRSLWREVKRFIDLTADEVCDLWLTAKEVGGRLERHHEASSLTFAIQDGPQAGQTVPHVHIHILPRKKGDFDKNDEIYDAIDLKEKELKEKLDLDKERKDRTPEEMAREADEYRALFS